MRKRAVRWGVVVFAVVAIALVGDNYLYKRLPSSVPSDAVFIRDGVKDVWVACAGSDRASMFVCRFYSPRSGQLLSAMKYSLIRASSPFAEKVKIIGHSGYESIETTDGTLAVFHPMEF